jgi:hypothetical protein
MNLENIVIALTVAYALIGALLLTLLIYARLPWAAKAAAIVVTSCFYVVSFYGTRGLLGWSSRDPLPPRFKLLQARIVEPHSLEGEPGAIHLWVEALDDDNRPSGVPRAYRLPYNAKLAGKTERAIAASAEGKPQGGRTADYGTGEGGIAEEAIRLVTPSTITTTGGGDPSSGGPTDPKFEHGEDQSISFTPLLPPRMPSKDTPERP